MVGLVGRLIDALIRLSLLVRGRVPGGTAAAAEQAYHARDGSGTYPYYGHVTRDRGFIVLQYWFLYAMNDWRSTFGGVNDHEADWEQVTVFLPDPPDLAARPAWVAFSSHDEIGDDLRRRQDDPDIEWRDTHPVVFAGAGSHSGAYLPGDYLITVEPPVLRRLFAAARRLTRLLLPWAREHQGTAFGIPFIDYRRGDGPAVGPGEEREWSPVLVDDTTPWLRDYRGLWGLDTGDPFGGERAPAGPRYGPARCGSPGPIRWDGQAWTRWHPRPRRSRKPSRHAWPSWTIRSPPRGRSSTSLGDRLRGAQAGSRALRAAGMRTDPATLAGLETSAGQLRQRRRVLAAEREVLARASQLGLPPGDPHAHLRHRALPNVDPIRTRKRVLQTWSTVSASFLMAGLAVIVLGQGGALLPALAVLAMGMLCVEAFARGHLVRFALAILAAAAVGVMAWVAVLAAVGNWRVVVAGLLALAALVLLVANIRDFFAKR